MLKKSAFSFIFLALLAVAGNVPKLATHAITVTKASTVAANALQPGDYKVAVGAASVTIMADKGGKVVEVAAKVESAAKKFDQTVITYDSSTGNTVITEIDFGGTKTKLVFVP